MDPRPVRPRLAIAERVRLAVQEARPGGLPLTVSAGVAAASGQDVAYEDLFRAADGALLRAKRKGRNRVVAADERVALAEVASAQLRRPA